MPDHISEPVGVGVVRRTTRPCAVPNHNSRKTDGAVADSQPPAESEPSVHLPAAVYFDRENWRAAENIRIQVQEAIRELLAPGQPQRDNSVHQPPQLEDLPEEEDYLVQLL